MIRFEDSGDQALYDRGVAFQHSFSDQFVAESIYLRSEGDNRCSGCSRDINERQVVKVVRFRNPFIGHYVLPHFAVHRFKCHIHPIGQVVGRTIHRQICERLAVE